jgi:hypothetical protein
MAVNRRQLFRSLALTAACSTTVEGAETALSLDILRNVSRVNGTDFTDDRLRVIKPVLEQHLAQLKVFRAFEVVDGVAPTQGILDSDRRDSA